MWPKLAGLAVIEAALLWLLTTRIPTHAVMLDPTDTLRAHELEFQWQVFMALGSLAAIFAIFVVPWLAYRVVRQHRTTQSK
jgi:hypothetical protein